jgi:hypothetical protein
LLPAPSFEFLVQVDFRPQAHLHLTTNALPAWGDGSYIAFPLLAADLHFANTGDVYPFTAGDFLGQRFQITLYCFSDDGFGQAVSLPATWAIRCV